MTNQAPMSDQNAKSGLLLRRRNKVIGFLIAEASAIGLLLLVGSVALSVRLSDSTLTLLINAVTIAAAAAVAIIPIVFFAIAPTLPRSEH
jgi:hypothetical protein